jgi:mono/diheme cytochrome c family protein
MSPIRVSPAVGALLLLFSWSPVLAQDSTEQEHRGELLLNQNCSRCHAVGRSGASPHQSAPPFRTLGQRYSIESLAEALAEGLYTGHPDMPEFVFEISDVGAILAYLQSIQVPQSNGQSNQVTK